MKTNQIHTRMSREDIDLIAKLARASYMTPAAMLRRLVLERLEQITLAQSPQGFKEQAEGETNEN